MHLCRFLSGGILSLSLTLLNCGNPLSPEVQESTLRSSKPSSHEPLIEFHDPFETEKGWGIFEEVVGGNPCYGDGIGQVVRSGDAARSGRYGLRVWANRANSLKSNHVMANNKLSNFGQTGIYRYELYAYIAPETGSAGQVGPEFSVQNTRQVSPGAFRTFSAGIQYIANPYLPRDWNIWTEDAPGQASWHPFMTQALQPGQWYALALEVDFNANRYVRFWLRGKGVDLSMDLSAYRIAPEVKFTEEAFWISLEAENLWNNCGTAGAFQYKVCYDQVRLHRRGGGDHQPDLRANAPADLP